MELTQKQYRDLLKMVYLANYILEDEQNEDNEPFEEVANLIYAQAEKHGCEKLMQFDQESGIYFPSPELEDEAMSYLHKFEEQAFWHELIVLLGSRDFAQAYSAQQIEAMPEEERITKEQPFFERYDEEFSQNGINNLYINSPK